MAKTADHNITIRLVDDTQVRPDPLPTMLVGETVRFSSPDGRVRVEFPAPSPFDETEATDSDVLTLRREGPLTCRCFLTPYGRTTELGWSSDDPQAGARGDVHRTAGH